MADVARIDKWLWAARIFKTRSIAADACKNGRVTIGDRKSVAFDIFSLVFHAASYHFLLDKVSFVRLKNKTIMLRKYIRSRVSMTPRLIEL